MYANLSRCLLKYKWCSTVNGLRSRGYPNEHNQSTDLAFHLAQLFRYKHSISALLTQNLVKSPHKYVTLTGLLQCSGVPVYMLLHLILRKNSTSEGLVRIHRESPVWCRFQDVRPYCIWLRSCISSTDRAAMMLRYTLQVMTPHCTGIHTRWLIEICVVEAAPLNVCSCPVSINYSLMKAAIGYWTPVQCFGQGFRGSSLTVETR